MKPLGCQLPESTFLSRHWGSNVNLHPYTTVDEDVADGENGAPLVLEVDGCRCTPGEISAALEPLIDDKGRLERLDRVVAGRTFNVLPILEGVYDVGNILSVVRTAEALGVARVGLVTIPNLAYTFESGRTSFGVGRCKLDPCLKAPPGFKISN